MFKELQLCWLKILRIEVLSDDFFIIFLIYQT